MVGLFLHLWHLLFTKSSSVSRTWHAYRSKYIADVLLFSAISRQSRKLRDFRPLAAEPFSATCSPGCSESWNWQYFWRVVVFDSLNRSMLWCRRRQLWIIWVSKGRRLSVETGCPANNFDKKWQSGRSLNVPPPRCLYHREIFTAQNTVEADHEIAWVICFSFQNYRVAPQNTIPSKKMW